MMAPAAQPCRPRWTLLCLLLAEGQSVAYARLTPRPSASAALPAAMRAPAQGLGCAPRPARELRSARAALSGRRGAAAALVLAPALGLLGAQAAEPGSAARPALPPRPGRCRLFEQLAPAANAAEVGTLPAAETLIWVDDDVDAQQFAAVLRTFNLAFITYLARFLLNYDATSRLWWEGRVAELERRLPPEAVRGVQLEIFAEFAASVQYGLRRYVGAKGVCELFDTLVRAHGAFPERRRHLALAFTFLEAAQPREQIAGLLRAGDGAPLPSPKFGTAPFSPGLPDYLSRDPQFLLPPTQVPVWDANLRRYIVLGLGDVRSYGQYVQEGYAGAADGIGRRDGSLLSVFGPRAKFAVQRERALTPNDYALFALSGAAGCCLTHSLVTPLDVVKTRMQTSPGRYAGISDGARTIVADEGWGMLFVGLQATLVGYAWYGMTVYPGYEFFSRLFEKLAGADAVGLHAQVVLLSGACATVLACVGVCPMEAARIRAVAQPDFAPGLLNMLKRIAAEDGAGSLYKGFGPIVLRQVIFGMTKFYTFDSLTDALFAAAPSLKATVGSQLLVSLLAGLAAGVASACVSQPADAMFSELNRQSGRGDIQTAAASLWRAGGGGPSRFFAGLLSRCIWSGSIISGQFFVYDIAKAVLGVSSDGLLLFLDVQFKDIQL